MSKIVHKYGKFKLMINTNALMIFSVLVCMTGNIYAIIAGRAVWGFCFGVFSVVCSKYVNEICPVELKGPFGGLNQTMLVTGANIPSAMALYYPRTFDAGMKDDFAVTQYWRIIWLAPIAIAVL